MKQFGTSYTKSTDIKGGQLFRFASSSLLIDMLLCTDTVVINYQLIKYKN